MNNRDTKLAHMLVNYSCRLKEGEKVLIEASVLAEPLVEEIINEVYKVKAYPFVHLTSNEVLNKLLLNTSKEHSSLMAKYMIPTMSDMNAYIGISAENNIYELSNVDGEQMNTYSVYYSKPVHRDIRVKKTKWVILKYPTKGTAQLSNKTTGEFEDFFYDVCTLDYAKMFENMEPLKNLMEKTDRVKIIAPNTHLEFSIKGIPAIKCAAESNVPDGEVFTAPVKDSVNGTISYNIPSMYNGKKFDNISFEFKNGKIVNATSSDTNATNKILDTDEGARYVGEFSFGLNPYITEPMYDILFDEKMAGSLHFTPGCCYDEAFNGNQSAVHWDLVLNQTKKFGGGEIWLDGKLVRKDGLFVLDELKGLNPESLK